MKIRIILPLFVTILTSSFAFSQLAPLTVEKIMRDPNWIGSSPSSIYWSEDGNTIYFNWNPDKNPADSLYKFEIGSNGPVKVLPSERLNLPSRFGTYNRAKSKKLYTRNGDLYLYDITTSQTQQITNGIGSVSSPRFSLAEDQVIYQLSRNLYSWDIANGYTTKLTDFKTGTDSKGRKSPNQEQWVEDDQLALIAVLAERKERREARNSHREAERPKRPKTIYIGKDGITNIRLSPKGDFVSYLRTGGASPKRTDVPNYVTESGFTENLNARPKVGSATSKREMWIYNIATDTAYKVKTGELAGIQDTPDYHGDYDRYKDHKPKDRKVFAHGPFWSDDGSKAIAIFRSDDHKDRWITLLDANTGSLKTLDRQRDEAWVAGPGINWSQFSSGTIGWLPDNSTIWFQSEESGYSHLYTLNVGNGKKKALTKGEFEIYNPALSADKQSWYFSSNKDDSGIRHFYRMPIKGGKMEKLTTMPGRNDVALSPDNSKMAIRHSSATRPWELHWAQTEADASSSQITNSLSEEFLSYQWRSPEYVTFKAADGVDVPARLYKPENPENNGPAVIFVHGAGYLQNAHKWWSSYFREYMFHNLLADLGYTVLDIDYRGSAGYGRDWRTAIYRHMGGKDLSDQVDGARYLVASHNVDPKRIGIYGGSYGGFITLMAMFNESETFAAGAALRSVTDWAHYNHPYTSNILNSPVEDSLAYRRSSPIYFAEGLQGPLLMAHGMIDTNVQFQDVVRLSQIFIELGKDNWELAVYPLESHGFREPSSWTDEYKRILKLFEEHLK